jgi:phosphoribosylamine--glycine ligase
LASKGYPDSYEKGFEITGIENAENSGCIVFHSGTKKLNGKIVTDGGRVLGVVGISHSLEASIAKAYEGAKLINFQNKYYRTDIGKKGLRYIK